MVKHITLELTATLKSFEALTFFLNIILPLTVRLKPFDFSPLPALLGHFQNNIALHAVEQDDCLLVQR